MAEELKSIKIDGTIVAIPIGERAFLITHERSPLGLEKEHIAEVGGVPAEERLGTLITKIKEALSKKKVEEVKPTA